MWKEITGEALPTFENINDANDRWIWEVVKKNLENYELSHDEIQNKAKEIFGPSFTKEFPKEGTDYLTYNSETNKYNAIGMGLDEEEDCFLLDTINKDKNQYKIVIIEYLEDYSNAMQVQTQITDTQNTEGNEPEYDIAIKNLNEEVITNVNSTEDETNIKQFIKDNKDKFSRKEINLKKDDNGNFYVENVKSV